MKVVEFNPDEGQFERRSDIDPAKRRKEWARYYGTKRIRQMLMQVHFLASVEVETVLEIGPYYGLTTALLDNAGFEVTTADLNDEPAFWRPNRPHFQMNIDNPDVDAMRGFDAIMCCATLEHVQYEESIEAMKAFKAAEPEYVLVSIPYRSWQIFGELFITARKFHHKFWWRKLTGFETFKEHEDPLGHKWEIGYKGYPLKKVERDLIHDVGYDIVASDFSFPACTAFWLLKPKG